MSHLEQSCILIVEDEYYLAKDVREALKQTGAAVMGPFRDHEEALTALEHQQPDCAIIDVNTGAGPDFRLADALQARGVPFIFFTGYDREVIPPRFVGVTRLEKPVNAAHLIQIAQTVCGKSTRGVNLG